MRSAWVCASCGQHAYLADRLEERLEFRRLSDQGRERVIKLRDICKACLRIERPTHIEGQGEML